jgi:hypothetical protein
MSYYEEQLVEEALACAAPGPAPITNETELEAALEQVAQLELEYDTGQMKAFTERIEKYEYMRTVLGKRISEKIRELHVAIDAYARPMLKAKGKAVYTGAFGTYRLTKRRTPVSYVDLKQFLPWCEAEGANVDGSKLYDQETRVLDVPNKERIAQYIQTTGEVPPGVELQDLESFSIKPDVSGLQGKVTLNGTAQGADGISG